MGQQKPPTTNEIKEEAIVKRDDGQKKESNGVLGKKYHDPMVEGVRWMEKYDDLITKYWNNVPDVLSTIIATFAIFTFGATLKGEWVVILVTALRQYTGAYNVTEPGRENLTLTDMLTLENLKMNDFFYIWVGAISVSYGMYFVVGGFLHWYFYVNRKHSVHEWKLQPKKWMSPELELHEIMVGSVALLVSGTCSALLACYIYNGNPSTIYYSIADYGWLWFFLQIPLIFLYQDYVTYVLHRLYHYPFLYKNFHKVHHKYTHPTAFSTTAIHPVEILHVQLTLCLPLFTVPVHWLAFYIVAIYSYYHGIIEHSGINFKAKWWQPWQQDAKFHDLHHQYFHVNFGFNTTYWDTLHGTGMKKGRVYNEETFPNSPIIKKTEGNDED